jgi:hypothetical protein
MNGLRHRAAVPSSTARARLGALSVGRLAGNDGLTRSRLGGGSGGGGGGGDRFGPGLCVSRAVEECQ